MSHPDYYKNKHIIVTGGSGYIGSALVQRLAQVHCHITVLTRKKDISIHNSEAKIHICNTDIREEHIWSELLPSADIIFHFAGQTSSKYANEHPEEDYQINVLPIIRLISACQTNNFRPDIIFAGTSTQTGLTKEFPVNESRQDQPITVYDINKLTAEKYLLYYSNILNGKAVSLRLTNIYGPGTNTGQKDRGILNLMVNKALHKEHLTLYGDGNYVRDYIYIDDTVEAFLTAAIQIDKLKGKYYIIGSGKGHTIKEMMELISNTVASKIMIKSVPFPKDISPIEYRNFVADVSAFQNITGWSAETDLKEGIAKTVQYFMKL